MRKFVIPIVAAVSTFALAAPASAQWYPQPQAYGYGYQNPYQQPYGYQNRYHQPYGYGHQSNHGLARALQVRVDRVQSEIRRLAQYRMISPAEYRNLRRESQSIERRLRRDARDGYGLNPNEAYAIQRRVARLEYRLARDARDGRRWGYRW